MNYPASLLQHLARYKEEHLGVAEHGVWRRNKKSYPHLLPEAMRELNLLEMIREPCLAYLQKGNKKLHRDFHHLNSSQAFALNLLFPVLVEDGGREALRSALALEADIVGWEFEAMPRQDEETNFDLLLTLASGARVYVEVKLTESAFGSGKENARRVRKLEQIYRPQLGGKVVPELLESKEFFKQYQLLRNVAFIDDPPGSSLVLVFPRANRNAGRHAKRFLNDSLLPEARKRVSVVYAEELAAALLRLVPGETHAAEAIRHVVQKYALESGTPTTA